MYVMPQSMFTKALISLMMITGPMAEQIRQRVMIRINMTSKDVKFSPKMYNWHSFKEFVNMHLYLEVFFVIARGEKIK